METKIKCKIEVRGQRIRYECRASHRARRLTVTVYPGGRVVVTIPQGFSEARAHEFLIKKSAWLFRTVAKLKKVKPVSGGVSPRRRLGRRDYLKYKTTAHALALSRLAYWNQMYNFTYNRVIIRNQKSRWGSCSRRGNLSFNFKITFLPPHLADYIIIHELCHLEKFDHSPAFWTLVARAYPDFKAARKELRSNSL